MDDLLPAILDWPDEAPAGGAGAAIVDLLAPAVHEQLPSPWLRDDQRPTAARLVAAVRKYNGALLADAVGSGKTFVALAAADAIRAGTRVAVLVPATLREQWRIRAASCGVPVEILSHAEVSRGKLPSDTTRIIVIDESHHFRDPGTQRYDHLCRFAVGRSVICVTATPAVNRLEEIAHQLRLGVRDDALARQGAASLLEALRRAVIPSALGDLIIASPAPPDLPARAGREIRDDSVPPGWLRALDALTLAGRGEVAGLIRGVLLTAAGSSPAALYAALTRYRDLLRQAADAQAAGVQVDRAAIRRFTADAPEQLLLWDLLPPVISAGDLPLDDLPRICRFRAMLRQDAPDPKAERLAALLGDGVPTLVFTTSIATVTYLRDRLTSLAPAWVTGSRAGWRHVPIPRCQVFSWFAPGVPDVGPRVLLASDVAAEGLDLQRASRVIHYDLPWTAMRVAQREGRARRLAGQHAEVEVITFEPPAWLEERIGIAGTIRGKSRLSARAGLSGTGSPWRWRQDLAAAWAGLERHPGLATVEGAEEALLIGVGVVDADGRTIATGVAVIAADGRWNESPGAIEEALESARSGTQRETSAALRARWRASAAAYARAVLKQAREGGWSARRQSSDSRALLRRLRPLLHRASRERRTTELSRLESLIDFTSRGHSAGEERQVAAMLAEEDPGSGELCDPGPGSGVGNGALRVELRCAVIFAGR